MVQCFNMNAFAHQDMHAVAGACQVVLCLHYMLHVCRSCRCVTDCLPFWPQWRPRRWCAVHESAGQKVKHQWSCSVKVAQWNLLFMSGIMPYLCVLRCAEAQMLGCIGGTGPILTTLGSLRTKLQMSTTQTSQLEVGSAMPYQPCLASSTSPVFCAQPYAAQHNEIYSVCLASHP